MDPFQRQILPARPCKVAVKTYVKDFVVDDAMAQIGSAEGYLETCFLEFLRLCSEQLECLCRSLLLLYCLALGRVLFGLTRLKGHSKQNARIIRARRTFSGAPLRFVFGVVAWNLPAALAVRFDY